MDGWIYLHKKFAEWEWYKKSEMVQMFIELLIHANYTESRYQGQLIKRGDCVIGRQKLSDRTGLSEQTIRTCLERLKSTNEITIKSTSKYSIITICKYEDYQNPELFNQPADQPINQPTTNQQLTNNQPHLNNINNNIYSQEADEIIRYLNQKIGSKYKSTSKNTLESINARMKDGFTVDDFKKVIDNKYSHWFNDDKMRKFLRPETLFAPAHFESYLNEPKEKSKGIGPTGVIL